METVKVREASEKQINFIKKLCLQTQTRLTLENEEIDNLDSKAARSLIKALMSHRVHPFIQPECQSIHKVNMKVMRESSSETKPATSIQQAILKNLYSKGLITASEFNSINSKEACLVIEKHLKGEEEMNTSEIVANQTKKGRGIHLSEQQKLQIKKLYLEEKMGAPAISKKMDIALHKIYDYLYGQKLTRKLKDYLKSPEAKVNRKNMHNILMEKARKGELKRKNKPCLLQKVEPSVVTEHNVPSNYLEDICVTIGGQKIIGKSSDVAKLLNSLIVGGK